jgi:hypothetical protein
MTASRVSRLKSWGKGLDKWADVGIEPAIVHTVHAFNMLGMATCNSCEGHLNGKAWQKPYPHVKVDSLFAPQFRKEVAVFRHVERSIDDMAMIAVQEYTEMHDRRRIKFPYWRELPTDQRKVFEATRAQCREILPGYCNRKRQFETRLSELNQEYLEGFQKIMTAFPDSFANELFKVDQHLVPLPEWLGEFIQIEPIMHDGKLPSAKALRMSDAKVLETSRSLFGSMTAAMREYYLEHGPFFPSIMPELRGNSDGH